MPEGKNSIFHVKVAKNEKLVKKKNSEFDLIVQEIKMEVIKTFRTISDGLFFSKSEKTKNKQIFELFEANMRSRAYPEASYNSTMATLGEMNSPGTFRKKLLFSGASNQKNSKYSSVGSPMDFKHTKKSSEANRKDEFKEEIIQFFSGL